MTKFHNLEAAIRKLENETPEERAIRRFAAGMADAATFVQLFGHHLKNAAGIVEGHLPRWAATDIWRPPTEDDLRVLNMLELGAVVRAAYERGGDVSDLFDTLEHRTKNGYWSKNPRIAPFFNFDYLFGWLWLCAFNEDRSGRFADESWQEPAHRPRTRPITLGGGNAAREHRNRHK